MLSIKIKKGYRLNIEGKPSIKLEKLQEPDYVALLPEKIPFIKPRLLTDVGDKVKIGAEIFEDKRNPDIKFLSPGGGEIIQINFGPRRIIREIVIKLDDVEAYEKFESLSEKDIDNIEKETLIKMILKGGLWSLIRAFPLRDIALPDFTPPAIFVSLGSEEPFQPESYVYLKGKEDLFRYGINILKKLSPNVYISESYTNPFIEKELDDIPVTHTYQGDYPADDPGVLLYHIRKSPSDNKSWYINGQDILLLAHLLKTGTYPTERTVVVAGSGATERKHIKTRLGVPLSHLCHNPVTDNGSVRYVIGGIFRGYTASKDSFLGFYETSLTLLSEGNEKEFFGFARAGSDKPSYSRAFLSALNPSPMKMNCNFHGDTRACVNCGSCAEVCPVDILPQFTFKAILADELEESLEHGMLDCVECGLCSYVCPSKIEICKIIKDAKAGYK